MKNSKEETLKHINNELRRLVDEHRQDEVLFNAQVILIGDDIEEHNKLLIQFIAKQLKLKTALNPLVSLRNEILNK